jgi:hypothetical protein
MWQSEIRHLSESSENRNCDRMLGRTVVKSEYVRECGNIILRWHHVLCMYIWIIRKCKLLLRCTKCSVTSCDDIDSAGLTPYLGPEKIRHASTSVPTCAPEGKYNPFQTSWVVVSTSSGRRQYWVYNILVPCTVSFPYSGYYSSCPTSANKVNFVEDVWLNVHHMTMPACSLEQAENYVLSECWYQWFINNNNIVRCDVMCTVNDATSILPTHGRRNHAQCMPDGVNDLDMYILSRLWRTKKTLKNMLGGQDIIAYKTSPVKFSTNLFPSVTMKTDVKCWPY